METLHGLKYHVDIVKRRALFFFLPFALLSVLGIAIVMALPAIYESHATILVEAQQIPADLVKSTVTSLAVERLQTIQQRVMARDEVLRMAGKFNLLADRKSLSKTELVELIRTRIKIAQSNIDLPNRKKKDDRLTIAFTVSYEDESPELATRVANELVTLVLNEDARSRSNRASDTTKFLEKEAKRLGDELAAVDSQISEFKLENTEALPEKLQFNMTLLDKAEENVNDAEQSIRSLDEDMRLISFEASVKASLSEAANTPGGRTDLEKRINTLRSELAAKSTLMAETHPEMRAMRNALKALELELKNFDKPAQAAEASTKTLSLDARMAAEKVKALEDRRIFLQTQREAFANAASALRAIIVQTPEVGSALAALDRKRAAIQSGLDDINAKYAQARLGERLEEGQQGERFEVIEQPALPQEPLRPARLKLAILSLAIAAAAGGGLAFAAQSFDTTIHNGADLEAKFAIRPFVVIPYLSTAIESRERKRKILLYGVAAITALALALAALHIFYMPLDVLMSRGLERFHF